jgi:CTP:molybdopterin cytidylyltransferase MocA
MIRSKNESKVGAVIVAAGMSSRMKDFKPLLPLTGSTLIGRAIHTLKVAGVSPIVVITGKSADRLKEYLTQFDVICLYNSNYEHTDMFDSAGMGLEYIKDQAERIFFLPADVPLFSEQSLAAMIEQMEISGCDILLPQRCGRQGHPILLKSSAVPALLSYDGGNGLKGAIQVYDGEKETMELPDIGMTMDADQPSDYELMKLLTDGTVSENIRNHSSLVAKLAVSLGKILNSRGYELNLYQIELAALLHDIARMQPNHASEGAGLLENIGHPLLAEIVRRHMKLLPEQEGRISEITVVYLADRYVRGTKIVTLEQRFDSKRESFHGKPEALLALEECYQTSKGILQLFENAVGFNIDPHELLKE